MNNDRSPDSYKKALFIVDLPIFIVVGSLAGYYLFGGNNSNESVLGAIGGAVFFFLLALIPIIKMALREHRQDMKKYGLDKKEEEQISDKDIYVKNTLFTSKQENSPDTELEKQ